MADAGAAVLDVVAVLESKSGATLVLLVTDRADTAAEVAKRVRGPVVVATSDEDLAEEALAAGRRVLRLQDAPESGLGLLPHLKEILLGAYLESLLGPSDRVLALASTGEALDVVALFDVARDLELGHLREEVGSRVPMAVVDRVLRLASELSHEGREGKPVGTLFVIGDADEVLARSRQAVLNPFQGHPPSARDVTNDDAWETVKEFAQLDGAFVIDERGVVLAAGRYIKLDDADVQAGLGGRHLAAASITRGTRAIAVAISSSGTVRVFKDGRVVMVFGKP